MHTPEWFARALKLIHPKYFAIYDEKKKKYFIRKWLTAYPRPRTWEIDSTPVCPVAFPMLDERTLQKLREGLYWARHAKELLLQIDRNNERLEEQADIETEYVSRYMAKSIYHYYREPTICMGVKGGDRPWKY